MCRAVYLASRRFILASRRSPSVEEYKQFLQNDHGMEHQSYESLQVGDPGKYLTLVYNKCLHLQMWVLASETLVPLLQPQVFTFNVDSGENVLKRCSVQQITNFLL